LKKTVFTDDELVQLRNIFGRPLGRGTDNHWWYRKEHLYYIPTDNTGKCGKLEFQIDYEDIPDDDDGKLFSNSINPESYFSSDVFSDVTIYSRGRKSALPAHKIVLAEHSPVFKGMFASPLRETLTGDIEINDAEPEHLEEFIKFLYTGKANIPVFARELLRLADKYMVDKLKTACEKELITTLTPHNCIELFELADTHNAKKLQFHTLKIFKLCKHEILPLAQENELNNLHQMRPKLFVMLWNCDS